MSDFKSVMKGGWHPKGKEGGKESWRGDFKGINQVAGWVGKGKGSGESAQSTHVSRPLATLKDPASFGPPPKNVNYHGGAALPNEITPHRGGLGAPLTAEQTESARRAITYTQEESETPVKAAPPLPYRADRTGLRTDNLPPPPIHRDLNNASPAQEHHAPKPTPSLPPRLPSRQNTATTTPPPPPSYDVATSNQPTKSSTPFLNQSAINRLGNAGVSVSALGIGRSNTNNTNDTNNTVSAPNTLNSWKTQQNQPSSGLTDLQSRFSRMNASSTNPNSSYSSNNNSTPSQATPSQSTESTSPQPQAPSWQQTRTALTTANSAYKDPSSVSLADAQAAAQTASNAQKSAVAFRERHNETINAAQTRASQINKRYNMTGRLNKFLEDANNAHDKREQEVAQQQQQQQTQQGQQQHGHQPAQSPAPLQQQHPSSWAMQPPQGQLPVSSPLPQSSTPELQASISRKPPPPPPPKNPASMQAPPPVPLGTRPNFG